MLNTGYYVKRPLILNINNKYKQVIMIKKTAYKYIHGFQDKKGVYFILSNKIKKPNPLKAKFAPFDDIPTKYLKIINRESVKPIILYYMDKWVGVHGRENKNLFYMPTDNKTMPDLTNLDPRIFRAFKEFVDSKNGII